MEQVVLDFLRSKMEEHHETFKQLEAAVGISDSTLCKWYSGKGEMSTYGLTCLAHHYGYASLHEFFLSIPLSSVPQEKQQEMDIVLRIIDECNADKAAHAHHCQSLLDHQQELRTLQQAHHEQLMAQELDHHARVVAYLRQQVDRFRLTAIILLALFILSLLFTVFLVVADIPQLGAGGSVAGSHATPLGFLRLVTVPLLILLLAALVWLLVSNRKLRTPSAKEDAHP